MIFAQRSRFQGGVLFAVVSLIACADCAPASQPTVVVDGQEKPVKDTIDPTAAQAYYEQGEAALKEKDWATAKKAFAEVLLKAPTSALAKPSRRGFATAALMLGDFRDAAEMLKTVLRESEGADRVKAADELLTAAEKVGDGGGVIEALAVKLEQASDPKERQAIEARVLQAIDHDLSAQDLDRLLKEPGPIAFAVDALRLRSAKIALHIGDFDKAKDEAAKVGAGKYQEMAQGLLKRLTEIETVKGKTVGVLLPLTGDKKQFGQSALTAIKLALGIEGDGAGSGIELVVRDSEGDADKAQRAVDELAGEQHVIAIIGPLFAEESLAAAVRAESYGVPMINLSRRDGIPQIGQSIFRLCLTPKQQAAAIAKLAFEVLGFKKFAIFYPNVPLGTEMADLFWDEVEAKNGEVRAVETFAYDQTTFMSPVQKLVGRYYKEARSDWFTALREINEQKLTGIKRSKAIEALQKTLPPITDFDAIFVPANAKQVGMIAPALAFEDIVTSTSSEELRRIQKTTGRKDITPVRLLGSNMWNSPQTAERGQKFVEGAVFVDGFFAQDPEPRVQKFVKAFLEKERREPALPDAQAYDAAAVLRDALNKNPSGRAALRKLLAETKDFAGVTGKIHFDADGEAERELYYLTIEKGQIVKFEPPEKPDRG